MFISNEQFGISLVIVAASCDYYVSEHRMSWLMFSTFAAQVSTSHFMGYQADKIGRRKLLLIASVLCIFSSFMSSLMPDFWSFLAFRFLVGVFVPGPGMALLTYLSEFTKVELRPKVINFLYYAIGFSLIYMAAVAMYVLPLDLRLRVHKDYAITSWRILMWAQLVPGIISCFMLWGMPESPKYYLSVGKSNEAYAVLERCCRYNKGKDVTLKSLGIDSLKKPESQVDPSLAQKRACTRIWYETKPIFQRPLLTKMLLIMFSMFLLFGTGFGLTVWIPRVLKMSNDLHKDLILCDMIEMSNALNISLTDTRCHLSMRTMLASVYLGACTLVFSVMITLLLFWVHLKTILLMFAVLSIMGGTVLNFVKLHELVVVCCILLTIPPLCCVRLALSILIDLTPTHLRSKAVSLATMFGRIGVLFTSMYVGYTLDLNCFFTFNLFVLLMFAFFMAVLFLPYDTRSGSIS
ncbi:synaptic vesicle glycoprotein 2C-like isoform X2 [Drosophila hydei]|nr:synaptic vesicle glycoprotein 2C-like isoform X2 [Drosophila hydei]